MSRPRSPSRHLSYSTPARKKKEAPAHILELPVRKEGTRYPVTQSTVQLASTEHSPPADANTPLARLYCRFTRGIGCPGHAISFATSKAHQRSSPSLLNSVFLSPSVCVPFPPSPSPCPPSAFLSERSQSLQHLDPRWIGQFCSPNFRRIRTEFPAGEAHAKGANAKGRARAVHKSILADPAE